MKILKSWNLAWWKKQKTPLPLVTTPYRSALEEKQKQWWLAGVLLLGLVGYYLYFYSEQQSQRQQLVKVVVAQSDLTAPQALQLKNLAVIQLPAHVLPDGTWSDPDLLVGKTLRRHLQAQQMVLSADVHETLNPDSITARFAEGFAFAVGEDWLASKLPSLGAGDYVDILVSNPQAVEDADTVVVAKNLRVIAVEDHKNRANLVVNVNQSQAQALLQSRSLRLPMQVMVRSVGPENIVFNSQSNAE